MANLVDVKRADIERQIGDKWGRVPHFVVDASDYDGRGVLYVPNARGAWYMTAFDSAKEAAEWLAKEFPPKDRTEQPQW